MPSTDTRIPETNNAESLSTVLTQGLRSQDLRLIDRCLLRKHPEIVLFSEPDQQKRLSTTYLSHIQDKLPGHTTFCIAWLDVRPNQSVCM